MRCRVAKFKNGDYVKIIPHPDIRSPLWDSNINDYFCGKIGKVGYIKEEEDGTVLMRVYVDFRDSNNPWKSPGENCAWFEDKHLIMASEYEYRSKAYLNTEYERYMVTEANMKKKRDDILRDIFTQPAVQQDEYKKTVKIVDDDNDDWFAGDGWFMKPR